MTFEELKDLKVGDRIVAHKRTYFDTKKGDVGTVIKEFNGEYVIVCWERRVGGWGNKILGIEYGHGEKININTMKSIGVCKNYKMIISCEDGKHTKAEYYVDDELISTSKTSRNEKYDDFNFKTAVDNCVDRMDFTDKTVTKGKGLIGRTIKKGQRVRIINVEPHEDGSNVCLHEYIGKEGIINYDYILKENQFGSSVIFDKKYMNAIDEENGWLRWRWDEIELID